MSRGFQIRFLAVAAVSLTATLGYSTPSLGAAFPNPDPRGAAAIPTPTPMPQRTPALMSQSDQQAYAEAIEAVRGRAYTRAHALVSGVADRTLVPILDWYELKSMPKNAALMTKALSFYAKYGLFPEWDRIVARVEDAMDDVPVSNRAVWFGTHAPQTPIGKIRYGELLLATGKVTEGAAMVRQGWREGSFSSREEKEILNSVGHHLTEADHLARLDQLLWDGKTVSAQRQVNRVGAEFKTLADARLALRTSAPYVDGKVARVPARLQNETGLVYERVRWRRRKGLEDSAADLLINSNYDRGSELRPDKMWTERRILIRHYLKRQDYVTAYKIAADHGFTEGAPFADAEWTAGWIQLKFLGDKVQAAKHFHTMFSGVGRPISLSRGAYWLADTLDQLGRTDLAQRWFTTAARYDMTFYGRLARERLTGPAPERPDISAGPEQLTADFMAKPVVGVLLRLHELGERKLVRRLFIDMIKSTDSTDELVRWAALGVRMDRVDLTVRAAKLASYEDIHVMEAAYPVLSLPGFDALHDMTGFVPEDALVLAIQRQESEFRIDAQSHVGASGLMQLMPATARQVARQLNLRYSASELLDNPTYNAMLGSAYLGDLITEFDGSYVMAVAGYNAGPHRVRTWIRDYGDPRKGEIGWVDWIELIPFSETRNYVQRVLEAVPIYRERLGEREQTRLALSPILKNGAQTARRSVNATSLATSY